MWLSELLAGFVTVQIDKELTHIALDSRDIRAGGVFFALDGAQKHGMEFASIVQAQGAVAIVYDPKNQEITVLNKEWKIPLYQVEKLSKKVGDIAARFYAFPATRLNIIGVTGTNGKTSCSQFLGQVLQESAVIGTLGWGKCSDLQVTQNTTPDAFSLQKILAHFVDSGIRNVAMEVSSHGLVQGRVNAVQFQGAVFNNLSRDHLDYHGNMESYFQSKMKLFRWPGLKFIVINLDDAYAERVLREAPQETKIVSYSLQSKVYTGAMSLQAKNIVYNIEGIECDVLWGEELGRLKVGLIGNFNLQNTLATLGVMLAMGGTLLNNLAHITNIQPVIGRMECFYGQKESPLVVIDYAHTPDALRQVLKALRYHCKRRLTIIFGCGGDRDQGKRQQMGKIAEELADYIIATDDNPRFEESQRIIDQIISDIKVGKLCVIKDRTEAIQYGIRQSLGGDVVLIAGKGHEQYQEIKGVKYPFSDRNIVQSLLS